MKTLERTQLLDLTRRVSRLMQKGQFMQGIAEIRKIASLSGIPNNDLARQVAELAIELGYVKALELVKEAKAE